MDWIQGLQVQLGLIFCGGFIAWGLREVAQGLHDVAHSIRLRKEAP